jgi:hypothetical protein
MERKLVTITFLVAASIKTADFWDVAPYSLVRIKRRLINT